MKSAPPRWNGRDRLPIAVLVDVDGTLAGPYRGGGRQLRESAPAALAALASKAPVFLWSITGADNGRRLLAEFPELAAFVTACFGKEDFPLDRVGRAYCIDDDGLDEAVLRCRHVILGESYEGGPDSGLLAQAASIVLAEIERDGAT